MLIYLPGLHSFARTSLLLLPLQSWSISSSLLLSTGSTSEAQLENFSTPSYSGAFSLSIQLTTGHSQQPQINLARVLHQCQWKSVSMWGFLPGGRTDSVCTADLFSSAGVVSEEKQLQTAVYGTLRAMVVEVPGECSESAYPLAGLAMPTSLLGFLTIRMLSADWGPGGRAGNEGILYLSSRPPPSGFSVIWGSLA